MTMQDDALSALDDLKIELPSWGFADTGTRFGKFRQKAAARTTAHKFHDAGLVHKLTGACPTVAVHVLWDFDVNQPAAKAGAETKKLAEANNIRVGSINPNIFQDQQYKLGSFCSPIESARKSAVDHTLYSVEIMKHTGSDLLSMWLADGTNYPGQDNIVARKRRLEEGLKQVHDALPANGMMLVEYKPFEPAFYHTDIADWGMAASFSRKAGKQAKVLVDTGHHLLGCNIEHIVGFLLDEDMLGGFHFNDRKYADDDLTLGSIDPHAVFRIFSEIAQFAHDRNTEPKIAYMIDQSHNLKPKLQAMIQTVDQAQKLYLKARLVDRKKLADAQSKGDITAAEECLRDAFEKDVRPMLSEWRKAKGLPANPLTELRSSGTINKLAAERDTGEEVVSSYA